MARTNPKPLRISVTSRCLYESLPIQALKEKGHVVWYTSDDDPEEGWTCDVIIGPRCWRIDPLLKLGDDDTVEESLERQLEMMEKGIRAIKYPKETKDAK